MDLGWIEEAVTVCWMKDLHFPVCGLGTKHVFNRIYKELFNGDVGTCWVICMSPLFEQLFAILFWWTHLGDIAYAGASGGWIQWLTIVLISPFMTEVRLRT